MANKAKVTFRHNKGADAVTMEVFYVRQDGAVQVRAVVPLEKARAFLKSVDVQRGSMSGGMHTHAALGLAAMACEGLANDAAEVAGLRNPFKRRKKGGRRPPPSRMRTQKEEKPDDGESEGEGGDKPEDEENKPERDQEMKPEMGEMGIARRALKVAAQAGVPGAGATLVAANVAKDPAAGKVLARARKGDPAAKAKVLKIRRKAAAGDPAAQHDLARLRKVNAVAKQVERRQRGFYEGGVS
jgi:hypothetical protein